MPIQFERRLDPLENLYTSLGGAVGQGIAGIASAGAERVDRIQTAKSLEGFGFKPDEAWNLSALPKDMIKEIMKQRVEERQAQAFHEAIARGRGAQGQPGASTQPQSPEQTIEQETVRDLKAPMGQPSQHPVLDNINGAQAGAMGTKRLDKLIDIDFKEREAQRLERNEIRENEKWALEQRKYLDEAKMSEDKFALKTWEKEQPTINKQREKLENAKRTLNDIRVVRAALRNPETSMGSIRQLLLGDKWQTYTNSVTDNVVKKFISSLTGKIATDQGKGKGATKGTLQNAIAQVPTQLMDKVSADTVSRIIELNALKDTVVPETYNEMLKQYEGKRIPDNFEGMVEREAQTRKKKIDDAIAQQTKFMETLTIDHLEKQGYVFKKDKEESKKGSNQLLLGKDGNYYEVINGKPVKRGAA